MDRGLCQKKNSGVILPLPIPPKKGRGTSRLLCVLRCLKLPCSDLTRPVRTRVCGFFFMTRNSNPPGRFAPPYIWVGSPAVGAYQPQLPQSSPQVMPDSFILDLEPTKFTLVPDLGSVVKLDTQNPAAVLFLQAATLPKGRCLAAGVPGFKFVTEQPKLASAPFVFRLTGAEDFVALAFKNNGPNIYLFGLSVSLLKDWNPPAKGDESEEAVLRLININHQSLIGACELANTETCALKDLTERLLMYLPTFNRQTRPKVTTSRVWTSGSTASTRRTWWSARSSPRWPTARRARRRARRQAVRLAQA